MRTTRAACAILAAVLSACSYHVDKGGSPASGTLSSNMGFSDVQSAILMPKCVTCHTHDHSWMTNYQTVLSRLGEISERIQSGDSGSMMPPAGSPSLTPAEKAALLAWIAKGGPQHPGQNNPIPPPPPPPPPVGPVSPSLSFAYVQKEVLAPKCLSCHHHRDDFDAYVHTTPLIKEMEERIHAIGTDDQMPPAKKPQLTPDELNLLDEWIHAGAPETGPAIPPLPTVTATSTATATATTSATATSVRDTITVTVTATTTSTASPAETATLTATATATSTAAMEDPGI